MSDIIQPPGWPAPKGYSNGIIAEGRTLFIGGQVGWDVTVTPPRFPAGFVEQFEQALKNVLAVLHAAGGKPEQLTRFTVYVTDKKEYLASLKALGTAWKTLLGRHYPAMALVQVVALVEDDAKIEIEATAVL